MLRWSNLVHGCSWEAHWVTHGWTWKRNWHGIGCWHWHRWHWLLSGVNWVLDLHLHILVAVAISLSLEVSTSLTLGGVLVLAVGAILISLILLVLLVVVLILVLAVTALASVRVHSIWLHVHHQSSDNLGELIQVLVLESSILFLLVTIKVLFVSSVFVLEVTVLLDFVMVDIESSSANCQILSVLYELSSVRGLVANEGIWALSLGGFKNSDGLNFSEASEKLLERFFSFLCIETFNIKIASLF